MEKPKKSAFVSFQRFVHRSREESLGKPLAQRTLFALAQDVSSPVGKVEP